MSGNTSMIVIAETEGYQSRSPSIDDIRDHYADIVDLERDGRGNLVFPEGAVARGGELIGRFNRLKESGGT